MTHSIDTNPGSRDFRTIGILDIFGFEDLHVNSFEQLCINYCNERLHNHYNEECFRIEQKVYAEEGINIDNIPFVDNSDTLKLFEDKQSGLLIMMDTEIYTPGGSNVGYLDKICLQHQKHASFARPSVRESVNSFKVHHYAGSVSYNTSDMLEKCRDYLHNDIEQCCLAAGDALLETIIKLRNSGGQHDASASTLNSLNSTPTRSMRRGSTGKQQTLGLQFMTSLSKLMNRLQATNPHFVKCIKPNGLKSPSTFIMNEVMAQLRYSGLLSLCKLRQIGYPARLLHADFIKTFKIIVNVGNIRLDKISNNDSVQKLIDGLQRVGLVHDGALLLGHTRVLMKQNQNDLLEEKLREKHERAVIIIQAHVRMWSCRRRYKILISKVIQLRSAMSYLVRGDDDLSVSTMKERIGQLDFALVTLKNDMLYSDGTIYVQEVSNADSLLTKMQEEYEAVEMIKNAIRNRDAAGLTHSIAYATRLGLSTKNNQQLIAAKRLLRRLEEEEHVVTLIRQAVLARDDAKLSFALSMEAAQELLKNREGSIYEEVNEGRLMLQRLLAEKQLTTDFASAMSKGDQHQIEVLISEMAAFGMEPPTLSTNDGVVASDAVLEAQQRADDELRIAIKSEDEKVIHEAMNTAINIGLQNSDGVKQAREKLNLTHQHVKLMTQMNSVSNIIEVKLKSVLGIETKEILDLEDILAKLELFENDLSASETDQVKYSVKVLNRGKCGARAISEMRKCIERNRDQISDNPKDYEILQNAVQNAHKLEMKCLLLKDAEEVLSKLSLQQEHARAMNAQTDSMSEIVRIAIVPRWRYDRYKQLRSPSNFARNSIFNKRKVMDSMLSFTREPIPNSLTQLPTSKVKSAIACHKGILGFTGTKKTTFPASFGHHILSRAINDIDLRNEVFLQIVKHMNGNKDLRSVQRCWILLCLCITSFGPTAEFELYLINFLIGHHEDKQFGRYCSYCLERLEQELDVDEDSLNESIYKRSLPSIDVIDGMLNGKSDFHFVPQTETKEEYH